MTQDLTNAPRDPDIRQRATDEDESAQWHFGYQSSGIAQRLRDAIEGEELSFRPLTRRVLVSGDSSLTWGDVFEELCFKGALLEVPDSNGLQFVRGGADLENVWVLGALNAQAPQRMERSELVSVDRQHNRWPDWLNAGFFLTNKIPDLRTPDVLRIASLIRALEAYKLPSDHPDFSEETIVQFNSPRSFGKPMMRLPYASNDHQSGVSARGKIFLVDGDEECLYLIERPFLAYKNDIRSVYILNREQLLAYLPLTRFLGGELIKSYREHRQDAIPLYRMMNEELEGTLWDKGDTKDLIVQSYERLNESKEGKINYGFNEPRWHFSVAKAAWGTIPPGWSLRKIEVPLDTVQEWLDLGCIDIGVGLGEGENAKRRGAMIEMALSVAAIESISQVINSAEKII